MDEDPTRERPRRTSANPPKMASDSARWPGRCFAVGGAGGRLGDPRLAERVVPALVPVLERGLVELGVELHAPRALADPEALAGPGAASAAARPPPAAARSRPRSSGCRRRRPAGRPARDRRRRPAAARSSGQARCRRSSLRTSPPCACASSCAPRQTPSTGTPRAVASRSSAAWPASPGSRAFCSPPSTTIPSCSPSSGSGSPRRANALVELRAGPAQRGPGVAEERALEVVDDGDPGGHPAAEAT